MRALLDVNVLIALLDENHTHHAAVSDWLASNIGHGWASCPLTQNGCVRILSQPRYPNSMGIGDAMMRLATAVSTSHHQFFPDDISVLDENIVDSQHLLGPGQLTDVYLLSLAAEHAARFVTLDKTVLVSAARRADSRSLVVI